MTKGVVIGEVVGDWNKKDEVNGCGKENDEPGEWKKPAFFSPG